MYSVFLCSLGVTIYIYIISRNCFTAWVSGFTHFCFKGTDLTENYIKIFLKTQFNIFVFSLVFNLKQRYSLRSHSIFITWGRTGTIIFFLVPKALVPNVTERKLHSNFMKKLMIIFVLKNCPFQVKSMPNTIHCQVKLPINHNLACFNPGIVRSLRYSIAFITTYK